MENTSILRIYLKFSILFLVFFLFVVLFFFTYYIHESGHVIFGSLDFLFKGKTPHPEISSFVSHPLIPILPLPQQTMINGVSLNFLFGGIILNILVFLLLSCLGYKISGDKRWFLLVVWIAIFEIFGNFLCGTDNLINRPYPVCQSLPLSAGLIEWVIILLFAITLTYLFYKSDVYKRVVGECEWCEGKNCT